MNPKKYTLSFSDGGTNMVSYFEEVELTIQSGNWSKETMDGLSERVAEAVKDVFGCDNPKVIISTDGKMVKKL